MSDAQDDKDHGTHTRDALDARLSEKLRALRLARPLPAPAADEPSDEELLRYVDGALPAGEREQMEARIARSELATVRVAVVIEALRESGYPLPKVNPIGRRAVRYVFRLAADALTFLRGSDMPEALAPALAVRGAAVAEAPSFFEFAHAFGAVTAKLAVERVAGHGCEIALTLVEGDRPVEGARVLLRRDGKQVDSAATENGAASFTGLPAARYQIDLRRGAEEIGTLHVDLLG